MLFKIILAVAITFVIFKIISSIVKKITPDENRRLSDKELGELATGCLSDTDACKNYDTIKTISDSNPDSSKYAFCKLHNAYVERCDFCPDFVPKGCVNCGYSTYTLNNGSENFCKVYGKDMPVLDSCPYYKDFFRTADGKKSINALLEGIERRTAEEEKREAAIVEEEKPIITFGAYKSKVDGDTAEPIEWMVLKRDGSFSLLISKYAIACGKYNSSRINVTWESCSLRQWLNTVFINDAFSDSERAKICRATIPADANPDFEDRVNPGNDTTDRIFIMSIHEANSFFLKKASRRCSGTEFCNHYMAINGQPPRDDAVAWWLRTPGGRQDVAAYVYESGSVCEGGNFVDGVFAIRPMMWIVND